MNRALAAAFLVSAWSLSACSALGQDLVHKAPTQSVQVAIVNATVHPVSSEAIERGFVSFVDGRIVAVGPTPSDFPEGTRVIDAEGLHVWPGLIAPVTELGLSEIAAVRQTLDINEVGEFTPEARAATAVNPDSTLIPVTRSNGILTFGVFPGSGAVPGTASVMRADGWTWEDMALLPEAGVIINWPGMRPSQDWWADEPKAEQAERIRARLDEIDRFFREAIAYRDGARTVTDLRYEATLTSLPGAVTGAGAEVAAPARPVFINAGELEQINAAVVWAVGLGLRPVIVGGQDAALCADLLVRHDVPVILEGTHRFPKRADSAHDEAYTLPRRLSELGVRWCLGSADRTAHERNLAYNAAKAVAFGLDPDAAVRGLTLSTAEILGVADSLGSLEAGKAATLIVTDGNPMELTTVTRLAFIDGREIDLSNKQIALAQKYREKYRQIGLKRDE
jgi:imidazolonepropionase-like amidohydrolase